MKAFMFSTLSNLFIRVASAYMLSGVIVVSILCVSVPIGQLVSTVVSIIRYCSNKWIEKVTIS